MSDEWHDFFEREHWEGVKEKIPSMAPVVGRRLRRLGEAWWEEYQEELVGYGKHELADILRLLRDQGTAEAKIYIALRMDRDDFEQYRDNVTDQLRGIAVRRARILEALEDLGHRVARVIGTAAGAALGF